MITDSEAPAPTEAEKNEAASATAAAQVQDCFDRALAAVTEAEKINALGDFIDPAITLAKVIEATKALNDARYLLTTGPWRLRTYEAIEQ